jgi:hypothetical protein
MTSEQMVTLALTHALLENLRALVVAGAKSPHTGAEAIMAAAQLLQIMAQAAENAPRANGATEHTGA